MDKKKQKDDTEWLRIFQLACQEIEKNRKLPADIVFHNAKEKYRKEREQQEIVY